ncbi:MAG: DUF2490 domain-containing protein [Cryomorphaceae bacterium]
MTKLFATASRSIGFFGICAFLVYSPSAISQIAGGADHVDGELWTSARVNFELGERWEIKTDHQFRTKSIVTEFDRVLSEVGVEYNPNDYFNFGVGGRYIGLNDNRGNVQGFEHHVRVQAEVELVLKYERIDIRQRIRYQNRNEIGISAAEGDHPAQDYRYKLSLEYDFRNWKLDPEIGAEAFFHQELGEINGFRRFRLFAGTEKNLRGPHKVGLMYMYEHQEALWDPKITHILLVKYSYTLKQKRSD